MKEVKPIVKHGWMRAILFAITYLVLIIFANLATDRLLESFNPASQETEGPNYLPGLFLLIRTFISLVITVLTVYFFRRMIDKEDLASLGLQFKNNFSHAATGFFLGLLLLGLGTFLLIANKNLLWSGFNFNPAHITTGLCVMAVVAFAEELVFRGYILNNLMGSMNKWLALLYSALIFALFHLNNPGFNVVAMINVLLAGLLLGINYIFTRNLWFGIFFHFAWNFYQGSILGFKVSGVPLKSLFEQQLTGNISVTGGPFGFEGSIFSALLILIAAAGLAWVYRKKHEGAASR